jgi:hypothetical protein
MRTFSANMQVREVLDAIRRANGSVRPTRYQEQTLIKE